MENKNTNRIIKGIITDITYAKDSTTRIVITTNQRFKSIDGTGKEIETDSFGIAVSTLLEFCKDIPEINLAKKLAMGKNINGVVYSLVLTDYEIEAEAEYKKQGEAREIEGQTYTTDCWKTINIKFGKKLKPLTDIEKSFLLDAIKHPMEWKKQTLVDTSKLDFE